MQEIGIFISLLLLIYIAYRGFSVILFAPIFALLAASMSGYELLPTYTEMFMPRAVGYIKSFFPIFMLGAVFGKIMEDSGQAKSIARSVIKLIGQERAMYAVVVSCGLLVYGGVSLFVVAFAVYPFAASLFREAEIPKRLIPGAIALGAFTFAMSCLPGSPQIQNIIPTKYFGTTAYAAPLTGCIAGALIFGAGMFWLERRRRQAARKGEGYGNHTINEPQIDPNEVLPSVGLSILPLLVVVIGNYVLTKWMITWDPQILARFPGTSLKNVVGVWSLLVALVCAILLSIGISWERLRHRGVAVSLNAGTIGSLLAIMNTASEVGYGNVIASLPGFKSIAAFLLSIKGTGTPLISEAISVSSLAGITGSGSGGLSIALETMGKAYLEWAGQVGMDPELLHRIGVIACGGLDTLPHNGAVITLLAVCGLTHKESYKDIGMCTLVIPFSMSFVVIGIVTLLGIH